MADESLDRREALRRRLKQVEDLLTPVLLPLGLEVICVEQSGAGKRAVLRISIDRIGAPSTVSIEDCATASRLFQDVPALDALFSGPWDLEFSSPGVDRPLVRPSDYERFAGERVVIQTEVPLSGRSKFAGRLTGLVDGRVGVDAGKEGQLAIPLAQIRRAHLKPDFAELLRRAEARNPKPELMLSEEAEQEEASSGEGEPGEDASSTQTGAPNNHASAARSSDWQQAGAQDAPGMRASSAGHSRHGKARQGSDRRGQDRRGRASHGPDRASGGDRSA